MHTELTEAQHERQRRRDRQGRYTTGQTCDCCGATLHATRYFSDIRPTLTARYSGKSGDLGLLLCGRCAKALGRRDDEAYIAYWQQKGGVLITKEAENMSDIKSGIVVSPGWLSPEGHYYPCSYGNHMYLAEDLIMALERGDAKWREEETLRREGWITINYEPNGDERLAYAMGEYEVLKEARLSPAQVDTLLQLDQLAAQEHERHPMRRAIDMAFRLYGPKKPAQA